MQEVVAAQGIKGLFAGTSALMGRTVTFNLGQLLTYDAARLRAQEGLGEGSGSIKVRGAGRQRIR